MVKYKAGYVSRYLLIGTIWIITLQLGETPVKFLKAIFRALDQDKSGVIEPIEVLLYILKPCLHLNRTNFFRVIWVLNIYPPVPNKT